jgi:type II secretory pathway pseudopilin PulG
VTARTTRRGYTLFELIVVMTLLILAGVLLPSLGAFRGVSRQRSASDTLRGELAVARAHAMEEGQPYRVAISEDGTRIRRAPDTPPDGTDFSSTTTFDRSNPSATAVDYPFETPIKVEIVPDPNSAVTPPVAVNGWITLATVQPDGTCLEDCTLLRITEDDLAPLHVRIRGLTSSSRVVPNNAAANGGTR